MRKKVNTISLIFRIVQASIIKYNLIGIRNDQAGRKLLTGKLAKTIRSISPLDPKSFSKLG